MSEVEKMKLYQNAGIEPTYTDECIIANNYWRNEELANEYGTFDKFMERNCKFGYQDCTDECEYAYTKTHYPPFTAEKQIELIKWLILNYSTEIIKGKYTNYFMSTGRSYKASGNDDLIICMANLINTLWQDLTPEEKRQVKGILE
jgi:hypothetical protein